MKVKKLREKLEKCLSITNKMDMHIMSDGRCIIASPGVKIKPFPKRLIKWDCKACGELKPLKEFGRFISFTNTVCLKCEEKSD